MKPRLRAIVRVAVVCLVGLGMSGGMPSAEAADPEVSISLLPGRYVFVEGDRSKFRAHHWMPQGYAGGVKELTIAYTLPDGTAFSAQSHALIDQNDLGADLSLKKDHLGFLTLDYSEFRKYYGAMGGTYYRFKQLSGSSTQKQLALDIGKLELETGLTLEGWPELILQYGREFKDGAKSHLTWTAAKEGTTTRNIGPSWQDLDETVDTFALKTAHEVAGVALTGEQRWEFVRTETVREEDFLGTTGAAADRKIRRQDQAPEATLMTTLLGGERWWLHDKAFMASAYRFAHMDNREFETIIESDEAGVATNFANPKQIRNARADNDYDTHTWTGNVMVSPWQWFSLVTKLKAEVIKRDSNSSYPSDTTPDTPDGIINTTEVSLNNTKAVRWGEGLSLRWTGLPRTAVYTELELEQARVLLREDRRSLAGQSASNANEVFNRETVTDVRRGAWTLGGRVDPWPFLDVTAHVRRRVNNNDYDDQRESVASGTALSAFIDEQNVHTDEFTTRLTYRPCQRFRSSFRYQFRTDKYATRAEAQDTVKTGAVSHIYTYDVVLRPLRALVTTASFSRQTAVTSTPARLASSANIPVFHADVDTWLFSADYTPRPDLTWSQTLQYSTAGNFNDFTASGLPLGADFNRLDLTTRIDWSVAPDTTVGTEYAFDSYVPESVAERGGYHAHTVWIEISKKF